MYSISEYIQLAGGQAGLPESYSRADIALIYGESLSADAIARALLPDPPILLNVLVIDLRAWVTERTVYAQIARCTGDPVAIRNRCTQFSRLSPKLTSKIEYMPAPAVLIPIPPHQASWARFSQSRALLCLSCRQAVPPWNRQGGIMEVE